MREIKTVVTGLPINIEDICKDISIKKRRQITFTSRLDPEKRVDLAEEIIREVRKRVKPIVFFKTHQHKLLKRDYYQCLADSEIVLSTAEHENFGIGTIEGMTVGCIPIVPNGLSYVDYVPEIWRYKDKEDAIEKIVSIFTGEFAYPNTKQYVVKYEQSIDNMIKEMELS